MNRRKPLPFMQLYTADYRRDTRHLTTEQHGAYLLILIAMWEQQGGLPEAHVERATELSHDAWLEHRELLAEFFTVKGGEWSNKRIKKDIAEIRKKSKQKQEAGRKGGQTRARNAKKRDAELSGSQAVLKQCLDSASSNTYVKGDSATPLAHYAQEQTQFSSTETELTEARERVWALEQIAQREEPPEPATVTRIRPAKRWAS